MVTQGNKTAVKISQNEITSLQFVSIIFVLFSLYLLGDAFYRWDGIRIYASFSDYFPSVALAYIIWSILSIFIAITVWVLLKTVKRLCNYAGLSITINHFVFFLFSYVSFAALVWIVKKLIWADFPTTFKLKLSILILIVLVALLFAWLLRNESGSWLQTIRERITPLIWIFSVFVILSIPLVIYHAWGKDTQGVISNKLTQPASQDDTRPNLLLVSFDALTSRTMSAYGYSRPTTPFIKQWAQNASLFAVTEAESNYTASTTASMMTGKRVWTHRKYQHSVAHKPLKSKTENIAYILSKMGYYNLTFIANPFASAEALGITDSIDVSPLVTDFFSPASLEGIIEKLFFQLFGNNFYIYNWLGQDDFIFTVLLRRIPQNVLDTEYPPEMVFNSFLKAMDSNTKTPFFAWIHVMPPHAPVSPPIPFAGTFNPSWELREKNKQYNIRPSEITPYHNKNLPFPDETKRKVSLIKDYYDEFILYCDSQFGDFIGQIQKRDWYEDTIIILTSDHGESFEHDYFTHGGPHLYEQVTHIPLIIREPNQDIGRVIYDVVEQIDLPATILDLVDITLPSWMEGRSLRPLMQGKILPSKPAISVALIKNSPDQPIEKGTISVWDGDYKLIHYLDDQRSLLFNLRQDPGELHNLFNKEPGHGQRLLSLISHKLQEANGRILKAQDK
jgi:arylsulfatase A-like enzyme